MFRATSMWRASVWRQAKWRAQGDGRHPLLRAHRVCQITQAVDTKHELQSAPIFSGLNMRLAPWSSIAPRVPASCFHRGMGERRLEPRASTTRLVARFESKEIYVRLFVFAYRAGRCWLCERITRDRRIRPESWKARCLTSILFTRVCVCLSSDHLRALRQGP